MTTGTLIQIVWWVGVVIAYLSLPLLLRELTRIVMASRKIYLYARDTRVNSRRLPEHLAALPALDQTTELLGVARITGGEIAEGVEALAGALIARAGGAR